METAVRWSPSSVEGDEKFLLVDVVGKAFRLCRVKSRRAGNFKYEVVAEHKKVPPFRAFDWAPQYEGIVAVGQESGEATVLRVDDGSQASMSIPIRNQRLCNAVALSQNGLLAAGLDKVRTDTCLHIFDLQQHMRPAAVSGFGNARINPEPLQKLASSEPVTSIKFFRREPQTLVAGLKGQNIRVYDLRESQTTASIQFNTRCVHNTAIDFMDENYFASCYPGHNPTICIWDRRAGSRPPVAQSSFFSAAGDSAPLRASLELRTVTESRGEIWSLRFSNTRRGCLTMLSSRGHLKTYDVGKEWQDHTPAMRDEARELRPEDSPGLQPLYLNGIQDLQHAYTHPKEGRPEGDRIVSFDVMNLGGTWNEPKVLTLTGNGRLAEYSFPMIPEPVAFSSLGAIHRGRHQKGLHLDETKERIPESTITPKSAVSGTMRHYNRCLKGYQFSLKKNETINANDAPAKAFWSWVAWARKEQIAGRTVQDNLDLAFLGAYALWMEDLGPKPHTTRTTGSSVVNFTRTSENLAKRLEISSTKTCATDYDYQRRLCLHSLRQAWTTDELREKVGELVSRGQYTEAAATAVFSAEPKIAYRALRSSSVQYHRILAIAIVSAVKRSAEDDDDNDEEDDLEWAETLEALAKDLTDPFALAILAYLKSNDWSSVIEEDSLPLTYRVGVAFRWLSDRALTIYVSATTKAAIQAGDLEGVVLTGLGTSSSFDLLTTYARGTGDLQTAVLALTWTIPRYIDDPLLTRQFLAWRFAYRNAINSWNLPFARVDFDITSARIAVSSSGVRLLAPAKPQIGLTCTYCNQNLATFPPPEILPPSPNPTTHTTLSASTATTQSTHHKTPRNPLTAAKAAAIGTICQSCGRSLPRCGVCDLALGMPDPTHLRWGARAVALSAAGPAVATININITNGLGSQDLAASVAGSAVTTLGPLAAIGGGGGTGGKVSREGSGGSTKGLLSPTGTRVLSGSGSGTGTVTGELPVVFEPVGGEPSTSGVQTTLKPTNGESGTIPTSRPNGIEQELMSKKTRDEEEDREAAALMARFIAFCVKCSHGFHADHARDWFRGNGGGSGGSGGKNGMEKDGHPVCPVPECACACDL